MGLTLIMVHTLLTHTLIMVTLHQHTLTMVTLHQHTLTTLHQHTSQHTLLSITLRLSMVRLPTETLPDHTTTSTQRERKLKYPTPLELMDSRFTLTLFQLLQLLTSSRLQLQSTPELLLSQSRTPPR